MVIDPEELIAELETWNVALNPPPEHTMELWNYVDPELEAIRQQAKDEMKALKATATAAKKMERERTKVSKKAEKAKDKPAKRARKSKPKKQTKKGRAPPPFEGFAGYYPPAGHNLEFDWGGDLYEGEFMKMEIDDEGDELCHLKDTTTGDLHRVLLREQDEKGEWVGCCDWEPLFECPECKAWTRGHIVCEVCNLCKDGAEDFASDSE